MPTRPIHAETPGCVPLFLSDPGLPRSFLCDLMLFSPAEWETFVSGWCGGFVMSAMWLVGAGPANPQIAKYVNPEPARIASLTTKLSALGCIHPPIVASSNAALLREPDSERDDTWMHGLLERYRQDGSDRITFEGWALVREKALGRGRVPHV